MTEYAEQFNVELKYKTESDLQIENILWTVRVSDKNYFVPSFKSGCALIINAFSNN